MARWRAQMQSEIVPAALRRFGEVPVRIDWYGDIVKRLSYGITTPYVQISCTRFPGCAADSGSPEAPSSFGLPVALLRAVRMGDLWQGGRRVGSAPLERVTFEGVVIDDESAAVVPAGLSTVGADGVARHELPFTQFAGHRGHTLSYLARVEIGGGCVLLVPSMEVVRFYFGACGSLLNNMFAGALAGDRLYSHAWKNEESGTANVTLDGSLPGVAAATVARIAFDKAAARQFRGIVNTGVKAAANRQKWYPRVGFPLVGVTTITAEGVWIDRETDRAFLAHRLLSCSHPFPFKKLYYRSEFATTKLGKPAVAGEPSHDSPEASLKVRLDEAKGASRTLAPMAVLAQAAADEVDPFPDLSAKQVRKVKQSARPGFSRSGRVAQDGGEVDLGIGGASEGGPRRGDVLSREPREEAPSTAPKSMQELLWSRVQWGEKSVLNFDAPMGGGPVARIELRLDDGRDVAYWACRLGLTMDEGRGRDESVLVIVAEEGGARDSTEMMLFKVGSTDEITPNKCAQLASAFWADDPTREALEDDDVLVGALTRERLAQEHGGLALTVVVDRLLGAGDAEVLPERTRIRPT
jgi:hypothetical protein